jgi:hypothetical protein
VDTPETESWRRRNWIAIAFATIVMTFSYFFYAAAFAVPEGETVQIDIGLLGLGLAVAPFVFVVIGVVSRNQEFPKRVLQSMGLLIVLGLSIGLLSPALGATAGFGAGGAITLNRPDLEGILKWRLWSVVLTVLYTFVLLIIATPAGVFTGGLLPLLMLGFADEYTAWKASSRE